MSESKNVVIDYHNSRARNDNINSDSTTDIRVDIHCLSSATTTQSPSHCQSSSYILTFQFPSYIRVQPYKILIDYPSQTNTHTHTHTHIDWTSIDIILCTSTIALRNILEYIDVEKFTGIIY